MRFCWTTIKVSDLEHSIRFYQDVVGLQLQRKYEAGPGKEIAFLAAEAGQTEVELIADENQKKVEIGNDISLGFTVASIQDKLKFVQNEGIKVLAGPISPNPEIEFFYVSDPDGVKIQFVENK